MNKRSEVFYLIIFLVVNFAGLALGGLFTGDAVNGEWYQSLNKAPWTPPGFMFGLAWTLIMILFAVYAAKVWVRLDKKKAFLIIYAIQWLFNFIWNPVFFYFEKPVLGLIIIAALTSIVLAIMRGFHRLVKVYTLLLAPYLTWLILATSLNAYIVLNN